MPPPPNKTISYIGSPSGLHKVPNSKSIWEAFQEGRLKGKNNREKGEKRRKKRKK